MLCYTNDPQKDLTISTFLDVPLDSIDLRFVQFRYADRQSLNTCLSILFCSLLFSPLCFLFFPFPSFRNAYRAEVATFVAPVGGESASDTRLRERIDFTSNILFFIEDLYLALGPGHVTTKSGAKINVASSLLWVRHQLAGSVKELMIAKKTGWQVLRNLKNEVCSFNLERDKL